MPMQVVSHTLAGGVNPSQLRRPAIAVEVLRRLSRSSSHYQMAKRRRGAAEAARHPNSAVGAPSDQETGLALGKNQGNFRFWHDERRFKGPGSVCVVQEALFAAGGVRTGGYPKAAPVPGPLGWQRPGDWDLLWTPARLALKAVPSLKPGQLVCACPGLMSLSRKRKLPITLHTALGPAAWAVLPQSFSLPEELPAFQQHMAARQAAGAGEELWILKTAQHLGKGLKLLPASQICEEAAKKYSSSGKPYVLAQKYVENPLLIDGHKFGIRVWVLVTGPNPLRAYLHCNGLVLFATSEYDDGPLTETEGGGVGLGHVTNYAQNVDGTVWDLTQLQKHLGQAAFGKLWDRISRSVALMCSAALGDMTADHAALKVPPESCFEVLGLDYLVDDQLHPWLLEVNGTPSLAVDHSSPEIEKMICAQKAGMVRDVFQLLGVSKRFKARYEAMRLAAKQTAGSTKFTATASSTEDITDEDGDDASNDEHAKLRAAMGIGGAKGQGAAVVLPRRIRDQLTPKSDAAIRARVAEELQQRGGFQPLMNLFPIPAKVLQADANDKTAEVHQRSEEVQGVEVADVEASIVAVRSLKTSSMHQDHEGELSSLDMLLRHANDHASIPWIKRDLELRCTLDALSLSSQ